MKQGSTAEFPIITVTFSFDLSNVGCINVDEVAKIFTVNITNIA
jgi:hypothetical protein